MCCFWKPQIQAGAGEILVRTRPHFSHDLLVMLGEDMGGRWEPGGVTSRGRGPRRMRVGREGQDGAERWASREVGLAAHLRGAPGWGHGREMCL